MEKKSTMVEFVEELKKLPKSNAIDYMIAEAKEGHYHDYKNTTYCCGKMEASRKLRALGCYALAKRIESGEFDEEADEEDKALMVSDLGTGPLAEQLKKILNLN